MSEEPDPDEDHGRGPAGEVCPRYHEAVELVGRRWTGAIVALLLERGPQRFSEITMALPAISDRVLSARMKELEARGLIARSVSPGPPVRVQYGLTEMGLALDRAVACLSDWARDWLPESEPGVPAVPVPVVPRADRRTAHPDR